MTHKPSTTNSSGADAHNHSDTSDHDHSHAADAKTNEHKADEHKKDEHKADNHGTKKPKATAKVVGILCVLLMVFTVIVGGYMWYYHGDSDHHRKSKAIDDALSAVEEENIMPAHSMATGSTAAVGAGANDTAAGHVDQSHHVRKATAERVF